VTLPTQTHRTRIEFGLSWVTWHLHN